MAKTGSVVIHFQVNAACIPCEFCCLTAAMMTLTKFGSALSLSCFVVSCSLIIGVGAFHVYVQFYVLSCVTARVHGLSLADTRRARGKNMLMELVEGAELKLVPSVQARWSASFHPSSQV